MKILTMIIILFPFIGAVGKEEQVRDLRAFVDAWNLLEKNMSKQEVIRVLGKPTRVLGDGSFGKPYWWAPSEAEKNLEFAVWFKEGKLFANQIIICGKDVISRPMRSAVQAHVKKDQPSPKE